METAVITCTICLENIQADEISTISPCSHKFCYHCIKGWLAQKSQCPLCQKDVVTLEHLEVSGKKIVSAIEVKKSFTSNVEEFECLDHDHFLEEYEKLMQRAEETEFDIKCLLNLKRNSSELDASYQMITQIIYEIDLKLCFLEKRTKIDTKSLVEDVHHFTDLLANFRVKSKGFDSEKYSEYYEEDYDENFYDQYVGQENQDVSVINMKVSKSKSKKKAKKGKKATGVTENTDIKSAVLIQ